MGRLNQMILFFALAGSAGCESTKRIAHFNSKEYAQVTFQVDGMMKAKSGAT